MNNLYRATITIPRVVYKQAKIRAAQEEKSLSRFVSDLLRVQVIGGDKGENNAEPPFARYNLGIKRFKREDLYIV